MVDIKSAGDWSRAVRKRDGRCLKCGATEGLHAHHIKRKAIFPELRYELSNGMTLCHSCHGKEHAGERFRSGSRRPQRKTLERKIAVLEGEIEALRDRVAELVRANSGALKGREKSPTRVTCACGLVFEAKRT